jgi:histone H3/H4
LVREIASELTTINATLASSLRFSPNAFLAMQEAVEDRMVAMFMGSNLMAIHAKRVTLKREDIVLWRTTINNWCGSGTV